MLAESLAAAVGPHVAVLRDVSGYLSDETESRNLRGSCEAVAVPRTADGVASVVSFAYERGVPVTTRGGGTGYAGGAVPDGGIVLSLDGLDRVRSFDPLLWRMEVEAGVSTRRVQLLALQNGLYFPPDPGAGEQSHIGGNIATNAGGPHAFKYGTTGAWVMGLEVVVAPGEVIRLGGSVRKDVATYDLKQLLIGSEGTLGIVTSAWLRLIPRPEASQPVVAFYADVDAGVAAIERVVGSGLLVSALEYLDGGALAAAPPTYLGKRPDGCGFAVLCEADRPSREVARLVTSLQEALDDDALCVHVPSGTAEINAIWRWREGMTSAVTSQRGGKVSEDIVVPLDRLAEAITATARIGERHGVATCSWGHAGDGNLHSTFMIDRSDDDEVARAECAADELFALAITLGGSISGEHGLGIVKRSRLHDMVGPRVFDLHRGVKDLFDPLDLLNPGKK